MWFHDALNQGDRMSLWKKSIKSWSKVDQKSIKSRSKVDQKSIKSRSKVDQKSNKRRIKMSIKVDQVEQKADQTIFFSKLIHISFRGQKEPKFLGQAR
jgi:hypothetical protein